MRSLNVPERSRRAKGQHSCGCRRCFYGAACLCYCWTQGSSSDFDFAIVFLFPIFPYFLWFFSPRFSWPIPRPTSRLCLFHRKSTVQLPTQAMDTFHATGSYKNQMFQIFGLGSFRRQLGANFQLTWRGCSAPTIQERTENRFFFSPILFSVWFHCKFSPIPAEISSGERKGGQRWPARGVGRWDMK